MKDSENPFAKAQREEKEAKQRLESRKRRKSPSPPQDDSTADKAKAVAEMISARLKANAPKTAEELEAERALEREAEARRVEEEARARKERIESGRKKVVEEVVEEKKAEASASRSHRPDRCSGTTKTIFFGCGKQRTSPIEEADSLKQYTE